MRNHGATSWEILRTYGVEDWLGRTPRAAFDRDFRLGYRSGAGVEWIGMGLGPVRGENFGATKCQDSGRAGPAFTSASASSSVCGQLPRADDKFFFFSSHTTLTQLTQLTQLLTSRTSLTSFALVNSELDGSTIRSTITHPARHKRPTCRRACEKLAW